MISVSVLFRLTHVFSVDTLIMQYIVSVYMQAADWTTGFLLYLDAYHLPYYCMSFNVQSAERTLQVSAR